jgi:hypothetical protein
MGPVVIFFANYAANHGRRRQQLKPPLLCCFSHARWPVSRPAAGLADKWPLASSYQADLELIPMGPSAAITRL